MLLIAIGFPVMILAMMGYFGGNSIPEDVYLKVGVLSSSVSFFLVVFFVIPDYKRNSIFRYVVDSQYITCNCPWGDNYRIPLSDVVRLRQVKYQAGQTTIEDFIETRHCARYQIPKRYDLSIYDVKRAIQSARPGITSDSVVRY